MSQEELSERLSDMFVKLGIESLRRKQVIEIDDGDLPFATAALLATQLQMDLDAISGTGRNG